jgi:bla regulator protein blaR1
MISDFLLNHLLQSTLFAAAAALLTLFFRKNHARVRYALWLAASIKFLVLFSLFIAIGSSIDFSRQQSVSIAQPALTFVEDISQPFDSANSLRAIPVAAKPGWSHFIWMPAIAMWLVGCLVFLAFYLAKGRRIRALVTQALPIKCGRAFEALQRLEQTIGRRLPIKLASASSSMEPGVFGIFMPTLLLPEGMPERLSDSELESILAHELAHIRRRDNLFSAVHMFIEALFWFHPMVWWIGAKLVQERERACDEEVLRLGKDPQAYAEGILKICEFYFESPPACVACATGSDMKKRIHAIMTCHIGHKLSFAKKLFLAGTGIAALVFPLLVGLLNAPQSKAQSQLKPSFDSVELPRFDVASVKPSTAMSQSAEERDAGWGDATHRVNLISIPLKFVMTRVFGLKDYQVLGPDWLAADRFDIQAVVPANAPKEQIPLMFQNLLAERFKLRCHWDTVMMSGYALTVAEGGAKLNEMPLESGEIRPLKITDRGGEKQTVSGGSRGAYGIYNLTAANGALRWDFPSITMDNLALFLGNILGSTPTVNETGLTKSYQIAVEVPTGDLPGMPPSARGDSADSADNPAASEPAGISLRDSLKRLGLKLARRKLPVERLVIDSIERAPTPN